MTLKTSKIFFCFFVILIFFLNIYFVSSIAGQVTTNILSGNDIGAGLTEAAVSGASFGPMMVAGAASLAGSGGSSITPRYTSESAAHVEPKHINPTTWSSRSKFVEGTDMQSFAKEVVSKGELTIQKNGLWRYDANLAKIIGTRGETGGRVILNPNTGIVKTQFPQFI